MRWVSEDSDGQVIFELQGNLNVLNFITGKTQALKIYIPDDGNNRRPADINVSENIDRVRISPDGARLIVVARGDLFSVPTEKDVTRALSRSSDAHDRDASWSSDGSKIVYISDVSGEQELWIADHDNHKPARQISKGIKHIFTILNGRPIINTLLSVINVARFISLKQTRENQK